jgi:hypothetical protein
MADRAHDELIEAAQAARSDYEQFGAFAGLDECLGGGWTGLTGHHLHGRLHGSNPGRGHVEDGRLVLGGAREQLEHLRAVEGGVQHLEAGAPQASFSGSPLQGLEGGL